MKFTPDEIIFAATDACNLHCAHCFVPRTPSRLSVQDCKNFLTSCKNSPSSKVEKIGFSGGEPFLYLDFITEIAAFAVKNDFMFDQIVTNGDWWPAEEVLMEKLKQLYDSGYDGKICLSWDDFHSQTTERMETFICAVQELFGEDSINIQAVNPPHLKKKDKNQANKALLLSEKAASVKKYFLPQCFESTDSQAWNARRWFKEDYCLGPGHIFFVHPNGKIAPCCGFANENPALFIGDISETYEKVMETAEKNPLIKIVYETGLSKYRKILKKQKIRPEGKTDDICTFCDFVCKNIKF